MEPGRITASKKAIKAIASGGKSEIELVIEAHGRPFATVKPKRQRVLEDQRLAVERGEILLKEDFLKAMDDCEITRANAKQKREHLIRGKDIAVTIRKFVSKASKEAMTVVEEYLFYSCSSCSSCRVCGLTQAENFSSFFVELSVITARSLAY